MRCSHTCSQKAAYHLLVGLTREYVALPILRGLQRVLEAMPSSFNVHIGVVILKNLGTPPTVDDDASHRALVDSAEAERLSALVDVFHLLPPAPDQFMQPLIRYVQARELVRASGNDTSCVVPLLRYLNRYPSEAVQFFFDSLADEAL